MTLDFHTPPHTYRRLRTPLAPPRERCEGDRHRRLLWAACPPLPTFLGEAAWPRTPSPLREPRTPMAPGRASLPPALEGTALLARCPPLPSFRDSSRSGCSRPVKDQRLSARRKRSPAVDPGRSRISSSTPCPVARASRRGPRSNHVALLKKDSPCYCGVIRLQRCTRVRVLTSHTTLSSMRTYVPAAFGVAVSFMCDVAKVFAF